MKMIKLAKFKVFKRVSKIFLPHVIGVVLAFAAHSPVWESLIISKPVDGSFSFKYHFPGFATIHVTIRRYRKRGGDTRKSKYYWKADITEFNGYAEKIFTQGLSLA